MKFTCRFRRGWVRRCVRSLTGAHLCHLSAQLTAAGSQSHVVRRTNKQEQLARVERLLSDVRGRQVHKTDVATRWAIGVRRSWKHCELQDVAWKIPPCGQAAPEPPSQREARRQPPLGDTLEVVLSRDPFKVSVQIVAYLTGRSYEAANHAVSSEPGLAIAKGKQSDRFGEHLQQSNEQEQQQLAYAHNHGPNSFRPPRHREGRQRAANSSAETIPVTLFALCRIRMKSRPSEKSTGAES